MTRTNLVIPQGTTWSISWPVTDANGQPIAGAGWSVRAQVRPYASSGLVLHEWSTTLGNATIVNGSVALTVSASDSAAWPWRKGVYDVELTDPSGKVARLAEGTVVVSPEVTR